MNEQEHSAENLGNTLPPMAAVKKEPRPPRPPKPPKTQEQLDWEEARRKHFISYIWQPILRPVVALVSICLVTSLLLGLTNALTAPQIEANAKAEADAAMRRLLPEADSFEEVSPQAGLSEVTALYRAANGAGWVIEAYGRGYGGQVPALVAFGQSGAIAGVSFPANNETPGLGQKLVSEPGFAAQFAGRPAAALSMGDIDKIASATISTGAAVNAVNAAVAAYQSQVLGQNTAAVPFEEMPAYLLPGETLRPIALSAPGVQKDAWRSEAGNYIIVGEMPNGWDSAGKPLLAAVAMDASGVIRGLWLDTSGESEQYGATLMTDAGFMQSFVGQSAPVQVDAVAGVTNSSASVTQAVNNALAALPLAKEAA